VTARHVYVHVPFCRRRCTYCDFSIAVRREPPVAEYLTALAAEWARVQGATTPYTLYLGGGTPSLLGGDGVAALATGLGIAGEIAEFTIEANPDDVTPDAAAAWRRAGVNRLSLGAQSFDDGVLAWMHRTHDAAAIGAAVAAARRAGFANLSVDLIFALPPELGRRLDDDLDRLLALRPDHVSLYGLTVEDHTPLGRRAARGELRAAQDTQYEDEYLGLVGRLTADGFRCYEVSSAARPGREAVHNRAYWLLAPYLGIGPSAHSFDGTSRRWNEPAYARWRARLARGESPVAGHEFLAPEQQRLEAFYLGLRTAEGVPLPEPVPPRLAGAVAGWVEAGWAEVERTGGQANGRTGGQANGRTGGQADRRTGPSAGPVMRLRLTPRGWLRLDELAASV
jgi:oxygen-independent coproporphyrinogen-3 oxidase